MEPNAERTGVAFGVQNDVPPVGGNAAQRREHDKRIGQGTMSRNGAWCPCCGRPGTVAMEMEDVRQEGVAGHVGDMMTAVVVDGQDTKEYRLPDQHELDAVRETQKELERVYSKIPHGRISEPIKPASTRSISCDLYGIDNFAKAFTIRQQLALGVFVVATRAANVETHGDDYPDEWASAVSDYLSLAVDRLADRSSVFCRWDTGRNTVNNTFSRFSLPMLWDFCETNPLSDVTGGYAGAVGWIAQVVEHCIEAERNAAVARAVCGSATSELAGGPYDVVLTDPPYYQAISYADLSDFFYIWQKRIHDGMSGFSGYLSPKDTEIVQHIRGDKERGVEKLKYESRMYEAFCRAASSLCEDGRFSVVFAHKEPEAWETLASAMIRAGFVVTASWPIQTEMGNRGRAQASAALASSLWLISRKRSQDSKPGWDNHVLEEMRERIATRLREFWDAGIRGPDFVWAATGPAMEAFSKHPIVKKANDPGKLMGVSEFLRHVRRMVVDFVVGRVLSHNGAGEGVSGLDDVTTYYLLHRHDFGMDDAPVGACILYAISCGLSDSALADQYDILIRTGGQTEREEDEEEEAASEDVESEEPEEGTGSKVKLRPWSQRRRASIGEDSGGRPAPLIDQVHRLMHIWKAGEQIKVDDYLDSKGLRGNQLFHQLLQALIELAEHGSEERSILESVSNHVGAVGAKIESRQKEFFGSPQE
jgi:adenine-specific DNA methylase